MIYFKHRGWDVVTASLFLVAAGCYLPFLVVDEFELSLIIPVLLSFVFIFLGIKALQRHRLEQEKDRNGK